MSTNSRATIEPDQPKQKRGWGKCYHGRKNRPLTHARCVKTRCVKICELRTRAHNVPEVCTTHGGQNRAEPEKKPEPSPAEAPTEPSRNADPVGPSRAEASAEPSRAEHARTNCWHCSTKNAPRSKANSLHLPFYTQL